MTVRGAAVARAAATFLLGSFCLLALAGLFGLVVGGLFRPSSAQAGCGCEKAPPDAAEVRPNATFAGGAVSLFHPALQAGQEYTVELTSGTTGGSAVLQAVAVSRRDLADGQYRTQLVIELPSLPLGPTAVDVTGPSGAVMALDDSVLTVVPAPIPVPLDVGELRLSGFQAAVGRDGTVYASLDLSQVNQPRVFRAQAEGYPLRFGSEDVVFYNRQGFLMQLLDESMPGLFALSAANSATDSDVLQYSRHEFNTFYLQHEESQTHQVDASDSNWHLDGTPHIDHDYLILAIAGVLDGGAAPAPGATPAFDLVLKTYTLFHDGLYGIASVSLSGFARTDSFNSSTGLPGLAGDIRSNGTVAVQTFAVITGNATGSPVNVGWLANITGQIDQAPTFNEFLAVQIPAAIQDLGSLSLGGYGSLTLGAGTYRASSLNLSGFASLDIDNTDGPVTLYVDGPVVIGDYASVTTANPSSEAFAVYVGGPNVVRLNSFGTFFGLVYAPASPVEINQYGQLYGSVVGNIVKLTGFGAAHYDTTLRGE